MVEITVKAVDSASAMEEIEKRLGADAMIVSTNRVDGQIEIVATNDDPSKYQKTPEPLVLDKNYRIKGFSEVLNSKLSADDKPLPSEISENHSQILKNAENIKAEIDKIVELSSGLNEINKSERSVHELFQIYGVKKSLLENAEYSDDKISMQIYPPMYQKDFHSDIEFEKWVTVEVYDFANIPNEMESFVLNEGLYAVFQHKGSSSETKVFEYIFSEWLPKSVFEVDERPHFEVLGKKYCNNDKTSEEEIWIPIIEK